MGYALKSTICSGENRYFMPCTSEYLAYFPPQPIASVDDYWEPRLSASTYQQPSVHVRQLIVILFVDQLPYLVDRDIYNITEVPVGKEAHLLRQVLETYRRHATHTIDELFPRALSPHNQAHRLDCLEL